MSNITLEAASVRQSYASLNCSAVYGPNAVDTVTTTATLATSMVGFFAALFVAVGIFFNSHFRKQFPLRIVAYMAITDCLIAINLLFNSVFCLTIDVALIEFESVGKDAPAAFFVYPFGYIANFSNWVLNGVMSFCIFEASRGVSLENREKRIILFSFLLSFCLAIIMSVLTFTLPPITFLYVRAYVMVICIFGTYLFCVVNYIRAISNLRRLSSALFRSNAKTTKSFLSGRDGGGGGGRSGDGGGDGGGGGGGGDVVRKEDGKEGHQRGSSTGTTTSSSLPPLPHSTPPKRGRGSSTASGGTTPLRVVSAVTPPITPTASSPPPTMPGAFPSSALSTPTSHPPPSSHHSQTQRKLSAKVKHLSLFLLPYCVCAFPTAVGIIWSLSVATPTDWTREDQSLRTFSIVADLCYSLLGLFTLLLLGQKLVIFYCYRCCGRGGEKGGAGGVDEMYSKHARGGRGRRGQGWAFAASKRSKEDTAPLLPG